VRDQQDKSDDRGTPDAHPISEGVRHLCEDRPASRIEVDLVPVAPAPVLARLKRSHDRVVGAMEMGGRVSVWRVVAAAHVAAAHAQPEVHPTASHLEAVLAAVGAGGDFLDLVEMLASGHWQDQAYDGQPDR